MKRLHEGALKSDPFISQAVGPNAKVERMKAAALRLGSQGVPSSYDDHLLIIGDAAGHIDPLTGEGIHTALMVRPLLVHPSNAIPQEMPPVLAQEEGGREGPALPSKA